MIRLMRYHAKSYISSNRYLMPLLSYIIILGILLSSNMTNKAVTVFSVVVAYFATIWSGFVYADTEDNITEQIMILKSSSIIKYYISKVLFVMGWGIIYSVIGFFIPNLFNMLSGLISRDMSVIKALFSASNIEIVVCSLIMHISVTVLGGTVGYLLHPRVFNNRKIGAMSTFSLAVIGFIKGPLFSELGIPGGKIISYLLPPLYEIIQCSNGETEVLKIGLIIGPCVIGLIYALVLATINVVVINKRGF